MRNERAAEPQMCDAAITQSTGRDWDAWVALLDAWGGRRRTHAEIARHIAEAHGIDGWWAQAVTVGYERIAGLREANQRPDGFSMNASKTVPLPVGVLFDLFVDDDKRTAWLGAGVLRLRTKSEPKSARFDVLDESGILAATFVDKGGEVGGPAPAQRSPRRSHPRRAQSPLEIPPRRLGETPRVVPHLTSRPELLSGPHIHACCPPAAAATDTVRTTSHSHLQFGGEGSPHRALWSPSQSSTSDDACL